MAILLLLLALFAAVGVFLLLVVGLMLLMALGTTYAAAGLLFLFGLWSSLGGLALSALSQRLRGPRWSWPLAALWLAVAMAVELGLAFAFRAI